MARWSAARSGFIAVLLVGTICRVALLPSVPTEGPRDILEYWIPWMDRVLDTGILDLYRHPQETAAAPAVDYPPIFLASLDLLGRIAHFLSPGGLSLAVKAALVKLPGLLSDVAVAVIIYRSAGAIAAALWYLNPAVIYTSAFWGQADSFVILWIVAAVTAAARRQWWHSGAFFALGLLTKPQAVVVAPVLVGFGLASGPRALIAGTVAATAVTTLGLLPFVMSDGLQQMVEIYSGTVGAYPFVTMGAFNPWAVVGWAAWHVGGPAGGLSDAIPLIGRIDALTIGLAALTLFVILVCVTFIGRLRRGDLAGPRLTTAALAAGLLYLGFFNLPTEMHERYVLPALAFLALAQPLRPGSLALYLALTLTTFLNLAAVEPPSDAVAAFVSAHRVIEALIGIGNAAILAGAVGGMIVELRRFGGGGASAAAGLRASTRPRAT